MKQSIGMLLLSACLGIGASVMASDTIYLSDLDLSVMKQGWGKPQINRSIRETPLTIAGHKYEKGVGTHARSILWLNLYEGSERFRASVGLDDAVNGAGTIEFKVIADGKKLFDSGIMKPGDPAREIDVNLTGAHTLLLLVEDAGDGINFDHADWADARFEVKADRPEPVAAPKEEAVILTPKPGPAPRLNGPVVYGCRPGHPFIYRIPTQGDRPMTFSARNLPKGLVLDSASGIITGTSPAKGEYKVRLTAKNAKGVSHREFKIVSGDTLALTPPLGWNHWYTHYDHITDKLMRDAADVMIQSGMADVGYQYVNIDDCWMNAPKQSDPLRVGPLRDDKGRIIPNKHFPDMKALTDYIHSKGLKAGIYTSPGPLTCGGFCGAYQHEADDAKQFAEWGFDFLKYDWCSYADIVKGDNSLPAFKKPYQEMGDLLKQQNRDIVFNLCQYGMGNVWEWGAEVGGHCWRTAGDLGFELNRIFEVALRNAEHRSYNKPGAWNDPDYIQIGHIGNALNMGEPIVCPLTPNEQYAFMSLWCLMASPIIYSGDMNQLDPFTLNVLCNPEVLDVDQDPLGLCARVISLGEDTFIMVKEMADGSVTIGLGNKGEFEMPVKADWTALGIKGTRIVRDLWRQTDLGAYDHQYTATVPRHAVTLLRLRAR
jgi:alpha-galactosidase